MTEQTPPPDTGRGLAGRWVRATFAGWALGFLLVLVFVAITSVIGLGDTQFAVGLGMGAGVGLRQSRLLAPFTGSRRPWVLASALGIALPFVVFDITDAFLSDTTYSLPVMVVVGGLAAGLLQWRILRAIATRAGWWVPASLAGWSLAGGAVAFNDRFLPPGSAGLTGLAGALVFIAMVLVAGVLLGVATAVALVRIVRRGDVVLLESRAG